MLQPPSNFMDLQVVRVGYILLMLTLMMMMVMMLKMIVRRTRPS